MAVPDLLLRKQISFGIAGVIFGFLMGFVVSHEMKGGRFARSGGAERAAAAPMGAGMAGGMSAPSSAPTETPGEVGMQTMEEVTRQLEDLRARLEKSPRDVEALMGLASLYMSAGMYDKALDYLKRAVEVNPADVHTRTELATALLMTGHAEEALKELLACVEREPGHARTWYSLGFAYVQTGEYDKGDEAFTKAHQLSPGSFDLQALRSEIEKVRAERGAPRPSGSPS